MYDISPNWMFSELLFHIFIAILSSCISHCPKVLITRSPKQCALNIFSFSLRKGTDYHVGVIVNLFEANLQYFMIKKDCFS